MFSMSIATDSSCIACQMNGAKVAAVEEEVDVDIGKWCIAGLMRSRHAVEAFEVYWIGCIRSKIAKRTEGGSTRGN